MLILGNILAFIVALGVIVFVHEAGHLLVAKAFRMRVMTFSLGFGKRLFGLHRGGTDYRVSAIPFGGYVRLDGELPGENDSDDPALFLNRPRWQRILVYLAGPLMNIALAIGLMAFVLMIGLDVPLVQEVDPIVGAVEEGSPAAAAGLAPGDEIAAIDGREVRNWQDVAMKIMESPGRELALVIERDGSRRELRLTPETDPKYEMGEAGFYPRVLPRVGRVLEDYPAREAGFQTGDVLRAVDGHAISSQIDFVHRVSSRPGERVEVEVLRGEEALTLSVVPREVEGKGRIGIEVRISQRFGFADALQRSVAYNWDISVQTLALLGKLFRREVKAQSALHGPIEIAALSGEAARRGMPSLLHLMALVSVSIAILNLLPVPVLDGGHILILLVESTMRRDLSLRLKEAVNLVGVALILALMVSVIFFDLRRNLPGVFSPDGAAEASER